MVEQETGGGIGVRDEGLLESALESVYATFGGQDLYPTKVEKGARLGTRLSPTMRLWTEINALECM